eukprot:1729959-Amphidinium_carterae.1
MNATTLESANMPQPGKQAHYHKETRLHLDGATIQSDWPWYCDPFGASMGICCSAVFLAPRLKTGTCALATKSNLKCKRWRAKKANAVNAKTNGKSSIPLATSLPKWTLK